MNKLPLLSFRCQIVAVADDYGITPAETPITLDVKGIFTEFPCLTTNHYCLTITKGDRQHACGKPRTPSMESNKPPKLLSDSFMR